MNKPIQGRPSKPLLRPISPDAVAHQSTDAVSPAAFEKAREIVDNVRHEGEPALRRYAETFGDLEPGQPLVKSPQQLSEALESIEEGQRQLLLRTAVRIRSFASQQRQALETLTVRIPGGRAGHTVQPVTTAGCYAPAGRFSLASSVLMTAITAREAGVETVWVASPRPSLVTMAAAAVASVDGLFAVGGAQAIAAMAYGIGPLPRCDVIVGPGNRWVTAAKLIISGDAAIDMLAGPSELVVLADESADPELIASDLLAQAEHDPDAVPILVTTDPKGAAAVDRALEHQLADLPTATTARRALENGFAVVVPDLETGAMVCNEVAPEHLELQVARPEHLLPQLKHYGGLFVGEGSAEVLGDYGAGPNHVLPTGGRARYTGGLSVLHFLRMQTWLQIEDNTQAEKMIEDAVCFARLEGLEAHARSAERRLPRRNNEP